MDTTKTSRDGSFSLREEWDRDVCLVDLSVRM